MRVSLSCLLALSILLPLQSGAVFGQTPRAAVLEPNFDFGEIVSGDPVEHVFVLRNTGDAMLSIKNVTMTPPLRPIKLQATLAPGQDAELKFALDTRAASGTFDGRIVLKTDDPKVPEIEMRFVGQVLPVLEITPKPAVILVSQRGLTKEAEVELVNRGREPVDIADIRYPKERVEVRAEPLESGRRYRIRFKLNGAGPAGRHEDVVIVRTSSKQMPELRVGLFTFVRERVYTFPDSLDLGELSVKDILRNSELIDKAAQTLMVYQTGGTQFSIHIRTDIPGLLITSEPGPKGDRFEITTKIAPGVIEPGEIKGSIFIETNDKDFPKLVIPVRGRFLP